MVIKINGFGQNSKLLVTLSPMDCGNCVRNLNNQLQKVSKEIPTYWLMKETYKNQISKLEKQLQIEIGSKVIFSDSLFSQLASNGSVVAVYKKDSLVYSFPINKIDNEHIGIVNSMVNILSEKEIFQLPDSLVFSERVTLKKHNNEYLLVDMVYSELTYIRNGQFKQLKGKSLLTKEIYYKAFHNNSNYDSIFYHKVDLQEAAYDEVKIMNATFGDSTIEVFCNIPVIKPFENKIGIYFSPAIVTLSKNLELKEVLSLDEYLEKKSSKANYILLPDLFEYFNNKFYFSYFPDSKSKLNSKVYSFASLTNTNSGNPKMNFLEITSTKEMATTLMTFMNSYFYFDLPLIYNPLLPFEYNLETATTTNFGINGFSYNELEASTKGKFSYSDLFHLSSIYHGNNFLVVLYRKNGKTIKEIYDINSRKLIYHYQFEAPLYNKKDGIKTSFSPSDWNKFVFLNGKNQLIEVTF